ncbi:hypothetical protein [Nonomuraea sp. B1E8]|uniref:hypothetical protein n=1 Tax=unclassified Nonomuraea TaxID=2593643 RepID=UPI00325C95DA
MGAPSEEQIGGNTLIAQVGRDGDAVTCLARTPSGRQVVVRTFAADASAEAAFDAEALPELERDLAASRRVGSPFVAGVLGGDVRAARPYVVRAHVEGETLGQALARGPFSGPGLWRMAGEIAAGLHAIYQAGVRRSGLTPDGVTLGPEGLRITDFGPAATAPLATPRPAYIAPEQEPSQAAEVFTWGQIVVCAASGNPSPTAEDLDVLDGPLRELVSAAVNPNPAARPGLDEVVTALRGAPTAPPPMAPPPSHGTPPHMAPLPSHGTPPSAYGVPSSAHGTPAHMASARRRSWVWGAVAAGVVLVLGAAAAFVVFRPDGQVAQKEATAPQTGQVIRADRLFPPPSEPAPDGGLDQYVNAAAVRDDTVVVVGGETVGTYSTTRPIFLVSDDSGATWKSVPPPGTESMAAGLVAGGDKGWVAFPSRLSEHSLVAWTSADGHAWQPVSGDALGDMAGYNLSGLVATNSGFVIKGARDASARKASPTAVWTSADGRQWQRTTTTTALPSGRTSMVAHGDNVLIDGDSADGTSGRLTARSADGGRTWQTATLDTGTSTPVLATDGKSFYAAFSKEFKTTTIAGSADGASWKELGSSEGSSPKGFAAGATGFYLLMDAVPIGEPGYGEEARLLHSEDGSGWDSLGTSRELNAYQPVMATTRTGALLSGDTLGVFSTNRPERLDLRLFSAGPDSDVAPIDFSGVAGLRYPVTRVNDLRHAGDVTVAVGQSQGMASAWWSTDSGATWQRAGLETPGAFTAVVHGPSGWLAIGPGVYTSRDGRTWQRSGHDFGTVRDAAAARDSYLVTSSKDAKQTSWRSTDLVTWQQVPSPFEFPSDLAGGEYGYVAPGTCPGGSTTANCLTYSADGLSWQPMPAIGLPDGQGAWVTEAVVGRDTVIVTGLARQGGSLTKTFSALLSSSGQWEKPLVAELGRPALSQLGRDGNVWIGLRVQAGEMMLVRSQDGRTWEPRTRVTWPKGMQSQAIAAAPGRTLVVGFVRTETEDYPVLGRLAP